jgi:hypothetical protein
MSKYADGKPPDERLLLKFRSLYAILSPPVVMPPAKITRSEDNDAAAKEHRACPRPAECLVQLLLVASYMSTNAE